MTATNASLRGSAPGAGEPSGSPVDLPEGIEDAATPLSLAAAHQALIERHAHLSERLPSLQKASEKATADYRSAKREADETLRSIKALERIRVPRRRKRA